MTDFLKNIKVSPAEDTDDDEFKFLLVISEGKLLVDVKSFRDIFGYVAVC